MKHEDQWQSNYEDLRTFVAENGHFPSKHTRLNNWCKYQRKRMRMGIMPPEQQELFEEVARSRKF